MEELVAVTTQLGFSEPTLIQKKSLSIFKSGEKCFRLSSNRFR